MINLIRITLARKLADEQTEDQRDAETEEIACAINGTTEAVPIHIHDADGVYLYSFQGEEGQTLPTVDEDEEGSDADLLEPKCSCSATNKIDRGDQHKSSCPMWEEFPTESRAHDEDHGVSDIPDEDES